MNNRLKKEERIRKLANKRREMGSLYGKSTGVSSNDDPLDKTK